MNNKDTRNKVLCIYSETADGIGAAWAVHRALDNVEFVTAKEGEQHELLTPAECAASGNCPAQADIPRSCNICDGGLGYCKKCYRVEIQLDQPCGIPLVEGRDILWLGKPPALSVLRAMTAEASSVLVLDHHETAQEDLREILESDRNYYNFAIFDPNRSVAGIAWDYLHPNTPNYEHRETVRSLRPRIINLIEDYELGCPRFGEESRAFHAVLMSYDITDLPAMFRRMTNWEAGAETPTSYWNETLNEGYANEQEELSITELLRPWEGQMVTFKNIRDLRQQVSDWAEKHQGWQPITTAPKDGTFLLCSLSSGMVLILQYGVDIYGRRSWRRGVDSAVRFHPTHWMPLPEPPK